MKIIWKSVWFKFKLVVRCGDRGVSRRLLYSTLVLNPQHVGNLIRQYGSRPSLRLTRPSPNLAQARSLLMRRVWALGFKWNPSQDPILSRAQSSKWRIHFHFSSQKNCQSTKPNIQMLKGCLITFLFFYFLCLFYICLVLFIFL